jgi:hypothetical protein
MTEDGLSQRYFIAKPLEKKGVAGAGFEPAAFRL